MDSAILKVSEVARRLSVSPTTVYRMLDRGLLRGVRVGRLWAVPVHALDDFWGMDSHLNSGDEELSAEDLEAIREGLAAMKRGEWITLDEYGRKRVDGPAPDLSAEDLAAVGRGLADVQAGRYVRWNDLRDSIGR